MPVVYNKKIIALNLIVLALFLISMLYYLTQQNGLTSKSFQINSMKTELNELTVVYNENTIKKASRDHLKEIKNFASTNGMVEADEVLYIYESGRVALKKL